MGAKSAVEQIRERFDHDVERFSSLETGQTSTMDARLAMELITEAAAAVNPRAAHVLDIGCGAGNYTLLLLQRLPGLDVTLVDLSQPMLERAIQRISQVASGKITALQGDIRQLGLGTGRFDIVLAAAVFHHLRGEDEWRTVFAKLYTALVPGGSLWISDLIMHATPQVQHMMWARYGDYLARLSDEHYRDYVFDYIAQEDSPRPLCFQLDLLRQVGFDQVEVLHKNACFASFGAIRSS